GVRSCDRYLTRLHRLKQFGGLLLFVRDITGQMPNDHVGVDVGIRHWKTILPSADRRGRSAAWPPTRAVWPMSPRRRVKRRSSDTALLPPGPCRLAQRQR